MNQHGRQPDEPDQSLSQDERSALENQLDQLADHERSSASVALESRIMARSQASLSHAKTGSAAHPARGRRLRDLKRPHRLAIAAGLALLLFGGGYSLWTSTTAPANLPVDQADAASLENELDEWLDAATDEPMVIVTGLSELTQEMDELQRRLTDLWPTQTIHFDEDSL